MKLEAILAISILLIASMFGALCGTFIGASASRGDINAELIKRGIKRYNQTTGVLEWAEQYKEAKP